MKQALLMSAMLPATALAHAGTVPHLHPHGMDLATTLLVLGIVAGGFVAWRLWKG